MLRYAKILPLALLCSLPCVAMENENQLMAIHNQEVVSQTETYDLAKTMDLKAAAVFEQQKLTILEQEELRIKEAKEAQQQITAARMAPLYTKVKDAIDAARGADALRKTLEDKLAELKIKKETQLKTLEQAIAQEKNELEAKIAQAQADKETFTKSAEECQAVIDKNKKEEAGKTAEKSTRRWFGIW